MMRRLKVKHPDVKVQKPLFRVSPGHLNNGVVYTYRHTASSGLARQQGVACCLETRELAS